MRYLPLLLAALALSGCVSVAKVETGDRGVGDRMTVKLEGAWNHIDAPGMGPAQHWTMEGLPVDQLTLYSGIKDGQVVHNPQMVGAEKRTFSFRSSMQPDEIVAMFEGMMTRDGSRFSLVKMEPAMFGGRKGFRFDYTLVRKRDSVLLNGFGYGAVSKGELFAILYQAPRLHFYPMYSARADQISRSALIKE
jgi:hypothetical protein